MSEVSSTLLKVQLSEYIPEVGPVVPDADGGKGSAPGSGNQGFNTILKADADHSAANTTIQAVPIAFFGLAFFILTFIILSIIKKRKNPYLIEGKSAKYTKLQVFSAASASILLAIVFNSAIFSTPYVGPVDTTVSEELTIDADILGTDNISYIKDTINVPSSEYGYELYISTDDTNDNRLIADSTEGYVYSITAAGELQDNTYGFSFVDPSKDSTKFQPIQLKNSGKTSVLSITPEQTEEPIEIWYGVRSKNAQEGVYRTNIEYQVLGKQDIALEDMTAEICNSLEVGIVDYEFTNSLGETQYVSKLKDGNCWTKPVPTEDPEQPSPVFACPTNWHHAKSNDYSELDLFYHVKDPDTTANPIIIGYDQTTEHPEGGCIADFTETTFTFDRNGGPDVVEMPSPFTEPSIDFETTVTLPDIPGDHPMKAHFRGWSITPDGAPRIYAPEVHPITVTSPNVVLYAIWDTKTAKAILDADGLLNFVYDYYTIQDVRNPDTGYKDTYEAEHAEITNVYYVPPHPTINVLPPWHGDEDVYAASFDSSFRDFKPETTDSYFRDMTNLESVTNLENLDTSTVTSMAMMFRDTPSLTELYIPEGFGNEALNMESMFKGATALKHINSPDGDDTLPAGFGSQATDMSSMFSDTVSLESIVFPNNFGEEAIYMHQMFAFYNKNQTSTNSCRTSSFTQVSFSDNFGKNVKNTNDMFGCSSFDSITLPAGFGSRATYTRYMFAYAKSLESIYLPAGFGSQVKDMYYMFTYTELLKHINSPDGNDTLPAGFGSAAMINEGFGMGGMFSYAKSLESIYLPAGFGGQVKHMEDMFAQTFALKHINSPDGDDTLPAGFGSQAKDMSQMFLGAKSLESIYLPAGFGGIAEDVMNIFSNATALKHINSPDGDDTLPAGFGVVATDIRWAFSSTDALTSLTLPNGFGNGELELNGMFLGTGLKTIYLPAGFGSQATNMGSLFRQAKALEHINSPDGDDTLPAGFGSQANDMGSLFAYAESLKTIYLPAGFGSRATNMGSLFGHAKALEHINSPDGDDTLPAGFGSQAEIISTMFSNVALTSITFPTGFGASLTKADQAFYYAMKLERIYVSDETNWSENVTSSSHMFGYANKLRGEGSITFNSNNANDITNAHVGYKDGTPGYFTRVCMKDNSCPVNQGQSNTNSYNPLGVNNTPDSVQSTPSNPQQTPTPEGPSPLGVTATKIDNSLAILFAIAMACLFSGTTMMILCIEKVKKDYREENEQF